MNIDSSVEALPKISSVPSDVLALLTSYLGLEDLVNCYLIENNRFSSILLNHGSILSLSCNRTDRKQSLAFFLRNLPSLTMLTISHSNWVFEDEDWLKLPSTIHQLDLSLFGGDLPVFDSMVELMPNLRSLFVPGLSFSVSMAISLPCTLERLEIGNLSPFSPLPVSVTVLKLLNQLEMPVLVSALPELRTVSVTYEALLEADFSPFLASLPQTLSGLQVSNSPLRSDVSVTQLLPNGLKYLEWSGTAAPSDLFIRSADSAASNALIVLPSGVSHLIIVGSPAPEYFAPFPSELEFLALSSSLGSSPAALLDLFPPTLTYFLYKDEVVHLPPTKFHLPAMLVLQMPFVSFNFISLSSLPRFLTTLWLYDITTPETLVNGVWPLETLQYPNLVSFWWAATSGSFPASLFRCLALGCPKLEECFISCHVFEELSACRPHDYWEISGDDHTSFLSSFYSFPLAKATATSSENQIDQPNKMIDQKFPKKAEKPNGRTPKPYAGRDDPPFRFPEGLKSFYVTQAPFGDELIATLPHSSITSIALPCSPFITDACFSRTIRYCHSLVELHCPSPAVTGASFAYLPRKLHTLILPRSELILDPHIRQLPDTLTILNLSFAMKLTNACAPALPRNLTLLDLTLNFLITQAITSCLPLHGTRTLKAGSFVAKVEDGHLSIADK